MPNERQSPFTGVDPQSLQGGPFSQWLQPGSRPDQATQPLQLPAPGGAVSPFAAIAGITGKFLQGVASGRKESFAKAEDEKASRLNSLNAYVTNIQNNPDLTDEAKQLAQQKYFQAIGAVGVEATKSAGKGGKDGGTLQHISGMMKDLFTGMTGGKAPKGMADVGHTMADIHGELFDEQGKVKPQYTKAGQVDQLTQQANDAAKNFKPGETQAEQVSATLEPILQKIDRLDPERAKSMRAAIQNQYPSGQTVDQQITQNVTAAEKALKRPLDEEERKQVIDAVLKIKTSSIDHYGPVVMGRDLPPGSVYTDPANGDTFPTKQSGAYKWNKEQKRYEATTPPRTAQWSYQIVAGDNGKPEKWAINPETGQKDHKVADLPVGYDWKPVQRPDGTTDYEAVPKQFQPPGGAKTPGETPPSGNTSGEATGGAKKPSGASSPTPPADSSRKLVADAEKQAGRKLNDTEKAAVAANPFAAKPAPPADKPKADTGGGQPEPGTLSRTKDGRLVLHAGARAVPLNSQEEKGLEGIQDASTMVDRLSKILDQKDAKTGKYLRDEGGGGTLEGVETRIGRAFDWTRYKAGLPAKKTKDLDESLNQAQSFLALGEVVIAQPYMQSSRAVRIWDQIKQHVPAPTDTPALMWEKLQNLKPLLPQFKKAVLDVMATRKVGNRVIGPAAEMPPGVTEPQQNEIGTSPF